MATPLAQGNLRDLASQPGAILIELCRSAIEGRLTLNVETDDGPFEENLFFAGGALVGVSSTEATDAGRLLGAAVAAAARPFGFFTFVAETLMIPAENRATVPTAEFALAYARAVPDVQELVESLCPQDSVLRLGDHLDRLRTQAKISAAEWKIIFRVNNKRTVREVADSLNLPAEEFARLLFTVAACGAVFPDRGAAAMPSSTSVALPPRTASSGGSVQGSVRTPGTGSSSSSVGKYPPVSVTTKSGDSSVSGRPSVAGGQSAEARKRALVVDDSRTVQRVVEMALAELNLTIDLADSGEQALELAAANRPDVVILDVVMTGMDGYKTCEALRKLFAPKKVPILMLTSKDGAFDNLRGKMAGATAYLTKPFDNDELRRKVREYLG